MNNGPQLHEAIHTEMSITHKTDRRGMRSFTWERTDLQKIWTVRCSTPKQGNSASLWIFKQSLQNWQKKVNLEDKFFSHIVLNVKVTRFARKIKRLLKTSCKTHAAIKMLPSPSPLLGENLLHQSSVDFNRIKI